MQKSRHYKKAIPGFSLDEVWVARMYDATMQKKLHRFKFVHNHVDSVYFETLFRDIIRESGAQNMSEHLIIYPAISLKDRIFRGPNHAKRLATLFRTITGGNILFCPLKKKMFSGHQSRRTKTERQQVQSEFVLKEHQEPMLKNKDIIIVDDVISTGYTAHTIGTLLKKAGARTVQGFFLSSKKI